MESSESGMSERPGLYTAPWRGTTGVCFGLFSEAAVV